MIYKAKKGQVSYGEMIGILLLDTCIPFPPGDVGNASTYAFPVRYKVVKKASIERLINQKDRTLLQPFIEASWDLVREGVRAITSDCGFMILFQKELSEVLPVPVFISSLLQIPFISRMLKPKETVGIITADSRNLTEEHLQAAGVTDNMLVTVAGLEDQKHFFEGILEEKGELDVKEVEKEVIKVGTKLVRDNKSIRAILLECSDLPPYAAALQKVVNLPIFDFTTMINYVFSGLVRKEFDGFM